ncbi:NAD(P)H-binding protein [Actinomycetospora sp. OC33-EN08]|uniref:NAD(P)H-binding protein n=1 Tax=Actinomycetospora aurantiaca TaxID=3129233 RepID=A0ABU8MRF5_9PSEU
MTVLVTGATGQVGRHLVHELLAAGRPVRALTRRPERADLPGEVEVVRGDLSDVATLGGVFDGVEAAHLITFGSENEPLTTGPEIVALAKRAGVRRLAVLSGDVERTPLEEAVAAGPVDWTFLRGVEFMANMLEWAPSVRAEGLVRAPFVDAGGPTVHEGDIAAVAAAILTTGGHAGESLVLTGPEVVTPRDKVRALGAVLGRDITLVEQSRDELLAEYRAQGWPDADIDWFLAILTDPPAEALVVHPTVREVTGREARSVSDWFTEHAATFG